MQIIHSLLHSSEIESAIVQSYGIDSVKCQLLKTYKNNLYLVSTLKKQYILKIYNQFKTEQEIISEIDFVDFLNESGVNVACPIATLVNEKYFALNFPEGKKYAILFHYINGSEFNYKNKNDAILYGKNVAKLHLASINYKPICHPNNINIVRLLNDSIDTLKVFFAEQKLNSWQSFDNLFRKINNKVNTIDQERMSACYIHADLHGENALKVNNQVFFYDFEYSGFGLVCYELSVFRWNALVVDQEDRWDRYLKGYRSLIDISDYELKDSIAMVCIRDIFVMASFIGKSNELGVLLVHDYYIQNRLKFLERMVGFL